MESWDTWHEAKSCNRKESRFQFCHSHIILNISSIAFSSFFLLTVVRRAIPPISVGWLPSDLLKNHLFHLGYTQLDRLSPSLAHSLVSEWLMCQLFTLSVWWVVGTQIGHSSMMSWMSSLVVSLHQNFKNTHEYMGCFLPGGGWLCVGSDCQVGCNLSHIILGKLLKFIKSYKVPRAVVDGLF